MVLFHGVVHEREAHVATLVLRAVVHDDLHGGAPALQLAQPVVYNTPIIHVNQLAQRNRFQNQAPAALYGFS